MFFLRAICLVVLFFWHVPVLAESRDIPIPPGFDPPQGKIYHLIGPEDLETLANQYASGTWLNDKAIQYTSKTPDAFFVAFTDGTVLHCQRSWDESDPGDLGFIGEGDWSALVAAGIGGLVNGLVMDIQDIGFDELFVLDWRLRSPTTVISSNPSEGPSYRLRSESAHKSSELSPNQEWVRGKVASYLYFSGRYDFVSLFFTDGSSINAFGPNYLGLDETGWRKGVGADWQALVTMGAMALGINRNVNLLLDGNTVVSWTLN